MIIIKAKLIMIYFFIVFVFLNKFCPKQFFSIHCPAKDTAHSPTLHSMAYKRIEKRPFSNHETVKREAALFGGGLVVDKKTLTYLS